MCQNLEKEWLKIGQGSPWSLTSSEGVSLYRRDLGEGLFAGVNVSNIVLDDERLVGVEFVVSYVLGCPINSPFSIWGGVLDVVSSDYRNDRLIDMWIGDEWWVIGNAKVVDSEKAGLIAEVFDKDLDQALERWREILLNDVLLAAAMTVDTKNLRSRQVIQGEISSLVTDPNLVTFHGFNIAKVSEMLARKSEGEERWFVP